MKRDSYILTEGSVSFGYNGIMRMILQNQEETRAAEQVFKFRPEVFGKLDDLGKDLVLKKDIEEFKEELYMNLNF